MARKPRFHFPGALYHVIKKCRWVSGIAGKVESVGKQDEQSLARGPGQGESKGDERAERHFRIPLTPLPKKGGKRGDDLLPAPAYSRQEKGSRQGGALFG
jgi:hypothetical protein